jgi:hypothetical protein
LGVATTDVDKINGTVQSNIAGALDAVDKANTTVGVTEIHTTLKGYLEGNLSIWTKEHAGLVIGLNASVAEWKERLANLTAAHIKALSEGLADEERIKAALQVTIAKANQTLLAVKVVVGVAKDNAAEIEKNITALLVDYAANKQLITTLNTSNSGANATLQHELAGLVSANVAIRVKIHILADRYAQIKALAVKVSVALKDIETEVKADIAAAVEKIQNVTSHVWAGLQEVKEELHNNVTDAQEEIKQAVNAFLGNNSATKATVVGLDGSANVSIHFDLEVKIVDTNTKADIEANIKIAVASFVGVQTKNVTVVVTGSAQKRAVWAADAQLGSEQATESVDSGASFIGGAVSLLLLSVMTVLSA